uniref:Uncharacterized protein n=1 Tax=Spongospora subterranea TaxID=70186 RepID=A0A0H5QIU0_9EUKA|eukprot:CRZ02010.1 hypothetical protein [Spongospora subterranea]
MSNTSLIQTRSPSRSASLSPRTSLRRRERFGPPFRSSSSQRQASVVFPNSRPGNRFQHYKSNSRSPSRRRENKEFRKRNVRSGFRPSPTNRLPRSNALPPQSRLFAQDVQHRRRLSTSSKPQRRNSNPKSPHQFIRQTVSDSGSPAPFTSSDYGQRRSTNHINIADTSSMDKSKPDGTSEQNPDEFLFPDFGESHHAAPEVSVDQCSAFVHNLPADADYDQVLEICAKFHPIEVCYASDGWRVTFANAEFCNLAIQSLHNSILSDHQISVTPWIPLDSTAPTEYVDVGTNAAADSTNLRDDCLNMVCEALLATVAEQAWRDVIDAPVFKFLEDWAGKATGASPTSIQPSEQGNNYQTTTVQTASTTPAVTITTIQGESVAKEVGKKKDTAASQMAPKVKNKRGRPPGSKSAFIVNNDAVQLPSPETPVLYICAFCGASDDRDQMAQCWSPRCPTALHCYCMAPPLRRVPRQWACQLHASLDGPSLSFKHEDNDDFEPRDWRGSQRNQDSMSKPVKYMRERDY